MVTLAQCLQAKDRGMVLVRRTYVDGEKVVTMRAAVGEEMARKGLYKREKVEGYIGGEKLELRYFLDDECKRNGFSLATAGMVNALLDALDEKKRRAREFLKRRA